MDYNLIYNCIKSDNIIEFDKCINENKSYLDISFGRFPLLSVMYLYKAKKIIKKYETLLLNKIEFIETLEPYELVNKFREKSKKILRLFYSTKVYPIDMLAVLHKDSKVKRLYKHSSAEIINNCQILKIYQIYGQKISIKNNKLYISLPKLNFNQTKFLKKYMIASCFAVLLISGLITSMAFTVGLGISFSEYKVYDFNGLQNAIKNNSDFKLYNDIQISDDKINFKNFSGNFDGNNKILTLNIDNCKNFIQENNGSIKNLNIFITTNTNEITKNIGLICNKNNGILENINIKFSTNKDIIFQKVSNDSISLCGLVNENKGTIHNIKINLDANIKAIDEKGDAYFSAVCGFNRGKIENIIVNSTNGIIATDVDITSICVDNFENGQIINAKNYVNLTQNNEIETWSPTISGICINNYGIIKNTANYGNLTVNSNNETGNQYLCFVAGIAVNNYNKIEKCLNKANIFVNSQIKKAIVGGLVCQSLVSNDLTLYSNILNSGNLGNIDINIASNDTSTTSYSYVGGLVAVSSFNNNGESSLSCTISNCFSTSKIVPNQTNNLNAGLLVGGCYAYLFGNTLFVYFNEIFNNFCLNNTETQYQIGIIINYQTTEKGANMLENNIKTLTNLQEMEQSGVYFNEI